MENYPSFDERMDNPQLQSCINHPQAPPVKGDPAAVFLVCACAVVAAVLAVGVVVWPKP